MRADRPKHGGDLSSFCRECGHELEECLDLSTGISPWAWDVPEVPQEVWQSLPGQHQASERFIQAAANYYGCSAANILAVTGSQWAIQSAPELLQPKTEDVVLLPELGYEEHRYAWSHTDVYRQFYSDLQSLKNGLKNPHVRFAVVIIPNNPTCEFIEADELLSIAQTLADRGGYLLVDEAFVDLYPIKSLVSAAGRPGLLIFRSLGKFFGLPGLRLGFVLGAADILQQLQNLAGPWNISSASEWLGARMLSDTNWIAGQRSRLEFESAQMLHCMQRALPEYKWSTAGLFVSAIGAVEKIENLRERLASQAILVRVFTISEKDSLIRIGLADGDSRDRLSGAIGKLNIDFQRQRKMDSQQVPREMNQSRVNPI